MPSQYIPLKLTTQPCPLFSLLLHIPMYFSPAIISSRTPKKRVLTNFKISKGQLISKCLLEKIVWTKIATKKFDNFCPGGQIKKIKAHSYINYGVFNVIKCLYFFDLTTRAEIIKIFRSFVLKVS